MIAWCMPLGAGKFPGLSIEEVYQVKQIMLLTFSSIAKTSSLEEVPNGT